MGDEIVLTENLILKISAPQTARFVIFKNGEQVHEETSQAQISFPAKETGTYRTEIYLDSLGAPFDKMPWIISNPIYVK